MTVIYTLWIKRYYAMDDPPELLVAWDEYSVDENPIGFDSECDKALASVGSDLGERRYIKIQVSRPAIEASFAVPEIRATVIDK